MSSRPRSFIVEKWSDLRYLWAYTRLILWRSVLLWLPVQVLTEGWKERALPNRTNQLLIPAYRTILFVESAHSFLLLAEIGLALNELVVAGDPWTIQFLAYVLFRLARREEPSRLAVEGFSQYVYACVLI